MLEKLNFEWELDQEEVVLTVRVRMPVTSFLAKAQIIAGLHQPVRRVKPDLRAINTTNEEDTP